MLNVVKNPLSFTPPKIIGSYSPFGGVTVDIEHGDATDHAHRRVRHLAAMLNMMTLPGYEILPEETRIDAAFLASSLADELVKILPMVSRESTPGGQE